jgi:hypothetical protein
MHISRRDLRLTISGDFTGRKSWADGKRSRLEQKLESNLVGLVTGAQAIDRPHQSSA